MADASDERSDLLVCAQHDFLVDPIKLRIEGEWLKATGTTLGADNGIGVAAGMILLGFCYAGMLCAVIKRVN